MIPDPCTTRIPRDRHPFIQISRSNLTMKEQSLLVNRGQAAQMLNCHIITIIRMENEGQLSPVRLRAGKCSKTQYQRDEIVALVKIKAVNRGRTQRVIPKRKTVNA
jgi:hypothetical protein